MIPDLTVSVSTAISVSKSVSALTVPDSTLKENLRESPSVIGEFDWTSKSYNPSTREAWYLPVESPAIPKP